MNFSNLPENLKKLMEDPTTIPVSEKVFRAFYYFHPRETKVIILGQDPYPDPKNSTGLAFSVEHDDIPPSLKNIFKELKKDLGYEIPKTGNLESWAKQGVLLLNTCLTTKKNKSAAHTDKGWEDFVANKVQKVLDYNNPIVIIAWGQNAQNFLQKLQLSSKTLVLSGAHPSPLNTRGGFLGGRYFSKTNEYLQKNNIEPINWKLT